MHELIAVLDFGSQYTRLIARRIREAGVYCEILPYTTTPADLQGRRLKGLILSGGPASVYEAGAPQADPALLDCGVPVLGVCYGMQWGGRALGCEVLRSDRREYGRTELRRVAEDDLFHGFPAAAPVWMSHGDKLGKLVAASPAGRVAGATILATSDNCAAAAVRVGERFRGIQFHPEVVHTPQGRTVINNFLFRICGCAGDWAVSDLIAESVERVRQQVGDGRVVCGLSGGVDSSVTAALVHRAVGDRLTCIFVDNGLLREGERERVEQAFRDHFRVRLVVADAAERFLSELDGVADPEAKRKIIGRVFIDVFRDEIVKERAATGAGDGARFLAQGTLYPDVIESRSPTGGPSATIKSHHNVGGLPEELGFELVEPLAQLFKDEVRVMGRSLGIPAELVDRHPFPGPGLAVRHPGPVTRDGLEILRKADRIVGEEIEAAGQYARLWQAFPILLPVRSVGVMGDARSYDRVVVLRAVTSEDGMTADWARLPYELLERISGRITNEVPGVNRVLYDITSKPPGTIEWE